MLCVPKIFQRNRKREYDGGVGPIRRLSQELSGLLVWIHVACKGTPKLARASVKARKISEVDGGHGKFNAGCCPPRLSVSLHFDATCIPAWSGADSEADSTVIFRGVIAETDSGMVQRWDSLLVSVA